MLVVVIVACEVLFWVFLVAGLSARYLLRRPRLEDGHCELNLHATSAQQEATVCYFPQCCTQ